MAETVAERIANALAERIVRGELAAGAPLRQDKVAAEFEASHVPAREAFQLLRAQGLAVSEPRRGVRVAPLDRKSAQEVVEIRASLEVLALTHAVPWLNAKSFERMEQALLAGDQAESIEAWESANRAFHREIVVPCRMPRLIAMLDGLQLANSRIIFAATRKAGWQPGTSQAHRQILDALRQRDAARAATLLQSHIRGLEQAAGERPPPL
ncbi:GntR family transcriptional regulator [Labrys neptuniae]